MFNNTAFLGKLQRLMTRFSIVPPILVSRSLRIRKVDFGNNNWPVQLASGIGGLS